MAGTPSGSDAEVVSGGQLPSTVSPASSATLDSNSISLQLTHHKLNGKNFFQWSRSIQLVIRGKGKFGYLDGSIAKPKSDDPFFLAWDTQNSMVMAWLIHSMEDSIGDTYLFYPTAKAIWDAVALAYSDLENSSQMYELRTRMRDLKQGDLDVTQYFHSLKRLWQELDLFTTCPWKDPEDAVLYKTMQEKDRIYDFLAGLDKSLDAVRGRILGTRPLPSLDEVFSEVRREESRRKVMLGGPSQLEMSALAAVGSGNSRNFKGPGKKPQTWCEHCKKPYHTKDKCWDLHGKPANWVPNRLRKQDSQGLHTTQSSSTETTPDRLPFSKAQLEQLSSLLSDAKSASSSLLVNSVDSYGGTAAGREPWVIDSGATDHMTGFNHEEEDWQC